MSLRSRTGSIASRIYPGLDEQIWNRQRDRDFPLSVVRNSTSIGAVREPHVLVVPQEGPDFESWRPGTRNFYF